MPRPPRWASSHSSDSRVTVDAPLYMICVWVQEPTVMATSTPRRFSASYCVSVCSRNTSCQPPINNTGMSARFNASQAFLSAQNGSVASGWWSQSSHHAAPAPSSARPASPAGNPFVARANARRARACLSATRSLESSWWETRSLQPRKSFSANEPVPQRGPLGSWKPTVMTAAFISGGGSASRAHWVKPRYDRPMVANEPVNHGW